MRSHEGHGLSLASAESTPQKDMQTTLWLQQLSAQCRASSLTDLSMCHPQVWNSAHGLSRCRRGLLPSEAENIPLDTLPLSFSASSAQSLDLGASSLPLKFLHPLGHSLWHGWPFSVMRLDGAMWKPRHGECNGTGKSRLKRKSDCLYARVFFFFSSLCSVPYYAERVSGSCSDEFHIKLSILLLYYWVL